MKVDKFAQAFPKADSKMVLAVKWSNFMQRTRKGGVKVWRETTFSELMYIDEFYNMVEKRIANSVKHDKQELNDWMVKVASDIERCLNGKDVEPFETIDTSITIGDHRLARYVIRPMKEPQFASNGAEYVINSDGIKRVGGQPWGYKPFEGESKLYGGNVANEDGSLKSEEGWRTKDAKSVIAAKAKQAEEAMAEAKESDVPFSVVDAKDKRNPLTGKPLVDMPKPSASGNAPSDKDVIKFTNKERKELDKFGLTVDTIPTEKPKGFQNKVWKTIHQKLAA